MKRIFALFLILFSTGAFADGPGLHDPIDISSKFLYDHSKILQIDIMHNGRKASINAYHKLDDLMRPIRNNLKNVYTISIKDLLEKCKEAFNLAEKNLIKYNNYKRSEMPSDEVYESTCFDFAVSVAYAANEENKRVAAEQAAKQDYIQNNPPSSEIFIVEGSDMNLQNAIQKHRENIQRLLGDRYCSTGTHIFSVFCTANGTELSCATEESKTYPNYKGDVFIFCNTAPKIFRNDKGRYILRYAEQ